MFKNVILFLSLVCGVTASIAMERTKLDLSVFYRGQSELLNDVESLNRAFQIDSIKFRKDIDVVVIQTNIGSGRFNGLTYIYFCDKDSCQFLAARFSGNSVVSARYIPGRKEIELFDSKAIFLKVPINKVND